MDRDDYSFGADNLDSDGLDSEEEERLRMEESLYCQMYFEHDGIEKPDDEGSCDLLDANASTTSLKSDAEKSLAQDERGSLKRSNDSEQDVLKSSKKIKTVSEVVKGKVFGQASTRENLDSDDTVVLQSDDSKVITIEDSSLTSEELIDSDIEIYIETESEADVAETSKKKGKSRRKGSGNTSKSVIDISDSDSSDSSLYLDMSSDGDVDINLSGHDTKGTLDENDEYLEKILHSLPADGDWKINNTDRFGSAPEKSRYYTSGSKVRCFNCQQKGHATYNCPEPKKQVACILCGKRGHLSRACSQSICFRCRKPGHAARDCNRKRVWREDACHRCGMQGHHFKSDCPDSWRQYHLTTGGDEVMTGSTQENKRKYCYNCAANGHFGHECKRRRVDDYSQPLNPFISEYDIKRVPQSRASNQKSQFKSVRLADAKSSESWHRVRDLSLDYSVSRHKPLNRPLSDLTSSEPRRKNRDQPVSIPEAATDLKSSEKQDKLTERQNKSTEKQEKVTERQDKSTEKQDKSTEKQDKSTEKQDKSAEKQAKLTEKQDKSAERQEASQSQPVSNDSHSQEKEKKKKSKSKRNNETAENITNSSLIVESQPQGKAAAIDCIDLTESRCSDVTSDVVNSSCLQQDILTASKGRKREKVAKLIPRTNQNWTNFASKMKDKLAELKKSKSAKEIERQQVKPTDVFQQDFLRLPGETPGSEKKKRRRRSNRKSGDAWNAPEESVGQYISFSNSTPGSSRRPEQMHNGNFERSMYSESGFRFSNSYVGTPQDFQSNSFIDDRSYWKRTSTPQNHLNSSGKQEMSPGELLRLADDQLVEEYYGRRRSRNLKRKERRKKNKTAFVAGENGELAKSNSFRTPETYFGNRRVTNSGNGFRMTIRNA